MRNSVVVSTVLAESLRLDVKHFVGAGHQAFERILQSHWKKVRLGEFVGDENIWSPPRCAKVPAKELAFGKPYLAPFDALRYVPRASTILSRDYTRHFSLLELKRGWLLIACSGRNLGPCVLVDESLSHFVISNDMIRITSSSANEVLYVMAFLHTPTGYALLRKPQTGSVIDHISPEHVRNITIPIVSDELRDYIIECFRAAAAKREEARSILLRAERDFLQVSQLQQALSQIESEASRRRFHVNASKLADRLDAEPYAPLYRIYREVIDSTGTGIRLADIALISRPPGRYKTCYVKDSRYGLPILSGRQLAQYRPVNLKFISPAALENPDSYTLTSDMVAMTADGRAEENLADCAMITPDRSGWAASGHIIRLTPREGCHPGLLYLACTCYPVQAQLKALATGSVVDALSESDVGHVVIPYPSAKDSALELANDVLRAWRKFAAANEIEDKAIDAFEAELRDAS